MKPERFPDWWDLVQAVVQVEEVVLEHFGFLLCGVQEGKSHLGGGLKMGYAGGELTPGRPAEAKNRAARGDGLWPAIGFDGSVYRIGGIGRRLGPACSLFWGYRLGWEASNKRWALVQGSSVGSGPSALLYMGWICWVVLSIRALMVGMAWRSNVMNWVLP